MKARTSRVEHTYIISVSVGTGCYRHLKVSGKETLHDLADDILWAFDFEHDHLYAFFMNNQWWSMDDAYQSPYGEEPPFADKIRLDQLGLEKGKPFKFVFDFGDEWRFQCKVLQVLEEKTTDAEIVRSKGIPPEQYPQYEEDDLAEMPLSFTDAINTDEEKASAAQDPITMTVNHGLAPNAPQMPALEIPDAVLEAAFRYRSDKLWKKLNDSDFFALKLSNGEIGYCSVMGKAGECNALALYIGDIGIWSIDRIIQATEHNAFGIFLSQNCLQLGLDNKSDIPEEELAAVTAYAESHDISFRGKNSYPNFLKFQSYLIPNIIHSSEDYQYLLEAMNAAHEVSRQLASKTKQQIGMGDSLEYMPLLTPTDSGYTWSGIPFPEVREYPYPVPVLDVSLAEQIAALPHKGTLECAVLILNAPTLDEERSIPVFTPLLIAAGTPAKLNCTLQIDGYYPDRVSDLLAGFVQQMLDTGCCPKKIITRGNRSVAFLKDFCEQCGILFEVADVLPKLDKASDAYLHKLELSGQELSQMASTIALLEQIPAEELRTMPRDLLNMLCEFIGTGILSQSLEQKLKKIR